MKRKLLIVVAILALSLAILPACKSPFEANGSIKSITQPYIAQYECTDARFGDKDYLKDFQYIKVVLMPKGEMIIEYKPVGGDKGMLKGSYKIDTKTREIEGELGIFGHRFKEKVKVEKGYFEISKLIGTKELYIRCEMN